MSSVLPLTDRPLRVAVLWCPDWPVHTVLRHRNLDPTTALAVIDRGVVIAASASAQEESVTTGLRVREAQVRCPGLLVVKHDPDLDERAFTPVARAVEAVVPQVHVDRPGLAAVRVAGAARFYGGEEAVLQLIVDQLQEVDLDDVRLAVADGLFAATQAARGTTRQQPVRMLAPGTSTAFLADLPVAAGCAEVDAEDTAELLRRMGIRTLGALGALPREQVRARFGMAGERVHRLAHGQDVPVLRSIPVTDDLSVSWRSEHPTNDTAVLMSAAAAPAAELSERLQTASLVSHEIRVVVTTEDQARYERIWRHAWPFTTRDILERVRWQLEDLVNDTVLGPDDDSELLPDLVTGIDISAESSSPAAHHAQGLWGERPDEHITHTVLTLQQDLGYAGVRVCAVGGGRMLHERRLTRPWGDALPPLAERRLDQPWPGALQGPAPATVYHQAQPAIVRTANGEPLLVDERGELSGTPARWRPAHDDSGERTITAWSGPWPVNQHWWDDPLQLNRFQIVDDRDHAWLLLAGDSGWWIEARYG